MYLFPPSPSLTPAHTLRLQALETALSHGGYPLRPWQGIHSSEASTLPYLLCAGGDGTLLEALPDALQHELTLVGLAMGRFNFLSAPDTDQPERLAEALIQQQLPCTMHPLIQWSDSQHRGLVLNDVVIQRSEPDNLIHIDIRIDQQDYMTIEGDGIILSSATGSTAYNLSMGGPMVYPGTEVMILTPIGHHRLWSRPLLLNGTHSVELKVHQGHRRQCDRQRMSIHHPETYTIELSHQRLKMVNRPFIEALQTKFM